jgi:hypothetical protein
VSKDRENSRGLGRARRLEPSGDVVGQRLGEAIVLVNLQTSRIFELNRTGSRFWELLQADGERERIERAMRAEFDVSEQELSAEIDALVARLEAENLVRVIE